MRSGSPSAEAAYAKALRRAIEPGQPLTLSEVMAELLDAFAAEAVRGTWEKAAAEIDCLASVITDENFAEGLRRMADRWRREET